MKTTAPPPNVPTKEQLASPVWRLKHIYSIQSKVATGVGAGVIPFVPNAEQLAVIDAVYVKRWEFVIIPKSRHLGMSTIVCLMIADSLLFGSGIQASVVDQNADEATKKLSQKIKFAFNALPDWLRAGWTVVTSNDSEFTIRLNNRTQTDDRTCFAGMRARGGVNHLLFVSEWGIIQQMDKARSIEILTGALPTAEHPGCVTIVESTWRGGKTGELWSLASKAMQIPEHLKGPKDPRILFFGWHTSPENSDNGHPQLITAQTHDYCDKIEPLIGKKLSDAQRLWWQKQKQTYGVFMSSEHPSTFEECLESPHQSAFFDTAGVTFQANTAIALEPRWEFGDIIMQPDSKATTWRGTPQQQAVFRMLERPQEGESYLLAADFCVGRQAEGATGDRDTNAYAVWKAGRICGRTGRIYLPQMVCACLAKDQANTVETIRRIVALHLYYGGCMTVVERNNKDDIAERLYAAGVTRMWTQQKGADNAVPGTTRRQEVLGWLTTGGTGGTRKQMLDSLQELVLQQAFIGSCRTLAHQLSVFVRNEKGVPAAASGEHDDWVMSSGIALFTISAATPYVPIGQQAAAKVGSGGWVDVVVADG